jgi:ketosteroid isomerase-like protein
MRLVPVLIVLAQLMSAGAATAAGVAPAEGAAGVAAADLAAERAALADTERAFSRLSQQQGMRAAFLAYLADDAVIFRPGPVTGRPFIEARPSPAIELTWRPVYVEVAASGDLGYTTGPYEVRGSDPADRRVKEQGYYVTMWRKEADGAWKVVADVGVNTPPPAGPEAAAGGEVGHGRISSGAPGRGEPVAAGSAGSAGGGAGSSSERALRAAERSFSGDTTAHGARPAYLTAIADEARLYRDGALPAVGREAIARALGGRQQRPTSWEPTAAVVSRAGDLGYTYGNLAVMAPGAPGKIGESGIYFHIWERQGHGAYKVVLDLVKMLPPAAPAPPPVPPATPPPASSPPPGALAPHGSPAVTLLVAPARLAGPGRAEMARLEAALDAAVAEMAPRVPLPELQEPGTPVAAVRPSLPAAAAIGPAAPIVVVVEDDFVAQARHAGEIGEAVPAATPDDHADLHLVYHPDDLFAYRVALAGRLIARAGLPVASRDAGGSGPGRPAGPGGGGAPSGSRAPADAAGRTAPLAPLPPWLARGAALWLAGDWYGRPYRGWLPWLAGAAVLPSAAELLAPAGQVEGTAVLWTPVAAALLDHLPGTTLAAKLDVARRLTPRDVDSWLAALASLAPAGEAAGAAKGRVAGAAAAGAGRRGPRPLPLLRGVSLAMENSLEGGYHAPVLDRQLDRLAALGADAVSLMPFAYEEGPAEPRLHMLNRSPESESDIGLIHAVRRARAHGLRTLYKPHIWVGGGSWPGDVAMRDEAAWQAWWRDYRRYVLHHAVLAAWAGADLFSVGCELSGTLGRAEDWRRLIAAVRQVFPGPLTYSGNWSGDLERAPFWLQLDLLGVDAYYPLSADPEAGRAELARGAAVVVARLAAASRAWHRPLLLTEVGFAACRAAWTAPHREGGVPSQADQAAAYAALFGALGRPPWLAGTFVWKAFSDEAGDADRPAAAWRRRRGGEAAADVPDFRFLGRQAEAVIGAYYRGGAGAAGAARPSQPAPRRPER